MEPMSSGGATVVLAVIVAAGVMSRRLRRRGAATPARTRALALVSVALLATGVVLAVTGGVSG